MFDNKTILITGGTGSFGQSFISYVLKNHSKFKKLIIFSRDELKQYHLQNKLSKEKHFEKIRFFIGDVRDLERLKIATQDVDLIIHAAALKQVPFAEYNPIECIKTNVVGAENIITSAIYNKVAKVIALSTDKAASPNNLYGASKLASDKLFVASNNLSGSKNTIFSVVRYGNVLNSRGSLVPRIIQIKKDKKSFIPITNKEMTRFIITLDEGVKFVINTFKRMRGGEIFIPKIPSVNICDLALTIAPNIKQKVIGIRPGEKIHEVMIPIDDNHLTYEFKKYYVIKPTIIFSKKINYKIAKNGEKGKNVDKKFQYTSLINKNFYNKKQISTFIKNINFDEED